MILALDIATRTGICNGGADTLPFLRSLDINAEAVAQQKKRTISGPLEVGVAMSTARQALIAIFAEVKPRFVAFEAPILHASTQLSTTRKLQSLAALVEELAFDFKADCYEVETSAVKVALCGYGGVLDKIFQVKAAQIMGVTVPIMKRDSAGNPVFDDNAADGFGVWLAALEKLRPHLHAEHWKPRQASHAWLQNQQAAKVAAAVTRRERKDKKIGQSAMAV